jgi:hypothetical protein
MRNRPCSITSELRKFVFPFPYLKNVATITRVEETVGGTLIEQKMVATTDSSN